MKQQTMKGLGCHCAPNNDQQAATQSTTKELAARLAGFFGYARILADGYDVDIYRRLQHDKRLVVDVFVNHEMRGVWTAADSDGNPQHPQARFWKPVRGCVFPRADYNKLKLINGKKEADRLTQPRVICYSPTWPSVRSLIRHLVQQFPDFEIVNRQES